MTYKKRLFIILIVVVFLIGVIFLLYKKISTSRFLKSEIIKATSEIKQHWLYIIEAGKKKDVSICEKIKKYDSDYYRNICYYNTAYEKRDIVICDKSSDTVLKYSCYLNIATMKNDISSYYRDICYNNTDYEKRYIVIHDKLPDTVLKFSCYLKIAEIENDIFICQNKASSFSTETSDDFFKNKCYEKIIKIKDKNKSVQGKSIALSEQNFLVCENIKDSLEKRNCYDEVGFGFLDINLFGFIYERNIIYGKY